MPYKVFVDGQEGTTGLRIFDYLKKREDIELISIDQNKRKDINARREAINTSDITFLCLPDIASRESASLVENNTTAVIDASTAFRTDPNWVYGLPELSADQREKIRHSNRIAMPGCHACAFILLVRPLVETKLITPDYPVAAYSITGYSGGGKKMIAEYEAKNNTKLLNPRPYALDLNHKHLPEMKTHGALSRAPIFTPIVGNFSQGLALTLYLHPSEMQRKVTAECILDCFKNYYQNENFIHIASSDINKNVDHPFFDVQATNGTNNVDIFVFADKNNDRFIAIARLDNLGKGAAGAAIQCMNIKLGVKETTGLACF